MKDRLETWFFIGVLLVVLFVVYRIVEPYLAALVLGVTFSIIFRPIYQKLLKVSTGPSMASGLTVLVIVALVFVPLSYVTYQMFQQATQIYIALTSGSGLGSSLANGLQSVVSRLGAPENTINFSEYARQALGWLIQNLGPLFSGIAQIALTIFLTLFSMYYFLKDGPQFREQIVNLLPLENRYADKILDRMGQAVNSVIRGSLTLAIIQGTLAGIGFFIFGVPNAVFWGATAAIAALVPTLGTSMVVIPAVLYLFFSGHTYAAVGELIWGMTAVGLIDNFLGPILMKRGTEIHSFFILLGVLGGINVFGPLGFLIGPLAIALFFAVLEVYKVMILKYET